MTAYRVVRDFGSHLGNHYRGEILNLPDGPLPRGFDGFVEKVAEYATKEIRPASDRANDVPAEAGHEDRPEPEQPPTPVDRAEAGYSDKMLTSARQGHGHVRPRPDGAKARCGGPGICRQCSKEATQLKSEGR